MRSRSMSSRFSTRGGDTIPWNSGVGWDFDVLYTTRFTDARVVFNTSMHLLLMFYD